MSVELNRRMRGHGRTVKRATASLLVILSALAVSEPLGSAPPRSYTTADAPSPDTLRVITPIYVISPVGGNGVKPTDRTDFTTLFMGGLQVLADRVRPSEKEFPMVKDEECAGDKPCEVVWVQITQETGGFNYTVQSRLIKAPSGTVDSHILGRPLFCHFNAAVDGESSDLHKSRIIWLARQLISHDKSAHQ